MGNRSVRHHGYANRTPWGEATREVPSAWLEDEASSSSSPYSLLASWKGSRGGVPSHVMIKLLRRRLRELHPDLMKRPLPPPRLQRAQDVLREIWARTGASGDRHPVWRLVEGMLSMALDRVGSAGPDHDGPGPLPPDRPTRRQSVEIDLHKT